MSLSFELLCPTPSLVGISLHQGLDARARILPHIAADTAYALKRVDPPATALLPARLASALGEARRTVLGEGDAAVQTVEHLLSALLGCGVVGALIELDGAEPPILDGSALPWVELIEPQLVEAGWEISPWRIVREFEHRLGASVCRLAPSESALVECAIDFAHPLIGRQQIAWQIGDGESYVEEIAPARTFGFLEDADQLRGAGLAQGANLESVLVFDDEGVVNEGELRFADEPVRHKLLDAIGDLALLGAPIAAGVVQLERPSHRLVIEALKAACASGALSRAGE